METLESQIQKLQAFNFQDELQKVIEDNKERIADLQATQLSQGLKSDGSVINPPYTPFTVQQKKEFGKGLGAVTDRVTFYDTGDLYKSFKVRVTPTQYEIMSDSFKFKKMIQRSGVNTVGLSPEYCDMFAQTYTRPIIAARFKEATGIGL